MSQRRAIICQGCYEDKDLPGTFYSRTYLGITTRGSCDVCGKVTICVRVNSEEAMKLGRREIKILKSIGIGLGLAFLLMLAYLLAHRSYAECREFGFSRFYCVTKNFIR